jgi:hypothetical protein
MLGQLDDRASQQLQCPAFASLRWVGAGGGNQQRRLFARQFAACSWTSFLTQCQFQVALHKAPLGSVDRRSPNHEAAREHVVADTAISSQQDLSPLEFARRMLAAIQHHRELRVLFVAQIDAVSYVHR